MRTQVKARRVGGVLSLLLVFVASGAWAQPNSSNGGNAANAVDDEGVMLGRVYRVDKQRYREIMREIEAQDRDPAEAFREIDPDEYLYRLGSAIVEAGHVPTNKTFLSEISTADGDFLLGETPFGAFRFSVQHDERVFPVKETLDLNVELTYVAELCFIIDEEVGQAWIVSQATVRSPDTPLFVPSGCRSAIGECLAMLTGMERELPEGILLLLAGGGSMATTLGIVTTDQLEASPLRQP